MTKLLLAVLSVAVLGAGGLAAASGIGGFEPAPVVSLPAASTTTSTTTARNDHAAGTEDVRGPCDEAEHRNDPRCTGTAATTAREDDDAADEAEDRSGREAEHEDNADDRSGSNSGKG
jgi:hypothetical protein